ncbi:MAG: cysteine hydrolase [Ignavibacteria bacterium]|nr:cysteine hydrolase [Ignavibacteria bacterium]MCC7159494.1 cysteine hydrolase [Ignavibacteria bacterium]
MKEEYFTKDNITEISDSIIRKLSGKEHVIENIQNTALLVLDMQRYFLEKASHAYIPASKAIMQNVNKLIETFESNKLPVIYTKHIDLESGEGLMKSMWGKLLFENNPFSLLSDEIVRRNGRVLSKSQYDAFYKTDLEEYLRSKYIENILICGVMTHLCCEHTARSAFIRGFNVIFPVDSTATHNLTHHYSSMANLSHGYAQILKCADFIQKF